MSDTNPTEYDDGGVPPDPYVVTVINNWLDGLTEFGRSVEAITDYEYYASELAEYADLTVPEASQMLQRYRRYNAAADNRCMYVIAHEGHYGPNAPWRLQSTYHHVPEHIRQYYRRNRMRHMTWEFYDHAKKEVMSFGAEVRQSVIQIDGALNSQVAREHKFAVRDYARDLLQNLRMNAQANLRAILNALAIPTGQRQQYMMYCFDGFWPYIEVMVDEEVQVLEGLIQ